MSKAMTEKVESRARQAIGLMSGTSLDGIDAALAVTDGVAAFESGRFLTFPYETGLRDALRSILGGAADPAHIAKIERRLTDAHADAVRRLLDEAGLAPGAIDVVGFHGHTILHRPAEGRSWQIGDGGRLARALGIDVVCDFRANDVAQGGEGAPFAPIFHASRGAGLERPLAVLNIGGVGNVTWIGEEGGNLLAFDTGPGNGLLDEWTERATGRRFDAEGALAGAGQVSDPVLAVLLEDPYFSRPPPKSLDRIDFTLDALAGLSPADGAATLVAFTCETIARSAALLPRPPARWLVTGGGRHNPVIMDGLRVRLGGPVDPVEAVGWQGDALEAQAFAYLAVRSLDALPLTFPGTTGVGAPTTGGRLFVKP
ncbi:MAG: anhydro-N-acetylmuramic acid kinase [Alphaproteobacteria bacterium]